MISADLSRITVDPRQRHGRPCVQGTRVRVVGVLEMLAAGASEAEILGDFPDLEVDDIRACLAHAAGPRQPIDLARLRALTETMPLQPESAADFVHAMRDSDRY